MLEKNLNFKFNYKDQVDRLYEVMTSTEIKAAFDSRGEDLKAFVYSIIDILNATTANSGARNIGFNGDEGIKATNVQDAIELLKKDIVKMALGDIPEGSIEDVKLSDLKGQVKDRLLNTIDDLNKTKELLSKLEVSYTDNKKDISKKISDIELVLKDKVSVDTMNLLLGDTSKLPTKDKSSFVNAITELFQSANNSLQSVSNGKAVIAGAVGVVTGQNSFNEIANYIAAKRNEIGGYLGAGDYPSLQRLCDWTFQRKTDLANQLVAKCVSANNQENLGQLVNKVSQIQTKGKVMSGSIPVQTRKLDPFTTMLTVNNLNFKPTFLAFSFKEFAFQLFGSQLHFFKKIKCFLNATVGAYEDFEFTINAWDTIITVRFSVISVNDTGFQVELRIFMGKGASGTFLYNNYEGRPVEWTALE